MSRLNLWGELGRMVAAGMAVVIACVLVDSLFYGQLTLVPLNFFLVNVYNNLGRILSKQSLCQCYEAGFKSGLLV